MIPTVPAYCIRLRGLPGIFCFSYGYTAIPHRNGHSGNKFPPEWRSVPGSCEGFYFLDRPRKSFLPFGNFPFESSSESLTYKFTQSYWVMQVNSLESINRIKTSNSRNPFDLL